MNPFKKTLDELKPHFTMYFIAIILSAIGVDAAIASAVSWAVKQIGSMFGEPSLPLHFYFVLGILVFCAILLSAMFLLAFAGFMKKREASIKEVDAHSQAVVAPPAPLLIPAAKPKPVDLQGQILELFFYYPEDLIGMGKMYVLMKVMIVNRGPDEASITSCGLRVLLGQFQPSGTITEIPEMWRIKRKREGVLLGTFYDEHPIEPRLGVQPHLEIYKKGHPKEGWLNFEFYSYGDVQFPNAQFDVLLTDSLGGNHCIRKLPELYRKSGEIVNVNHISLPSST